MTRYIRSAFDGVNPVENSGDTFFIYDPARDLPPERWFPFATIVTGDRHDTVSDLDRPGAYRLNIGLTKATYVSRFGAAPRDRDEHGVLRTGFDYAAADTLMPHPVYGSQYWVCVVNPGEATLDTVRDLLAEAYEFAVRKYANALRPGYALPAALPAAVRPGPGTTSMSCGATGWPHSVQVKAARSRPPQSRWWASRGGPAGPARCRSPHCMRATSGVASSRPIGVSWYSCRVGRCWYATRSSTPASTSRLSRSVSTLRAMPRLVRKSSNRRSPSRLSRTRRRVHRSPSTSRARAIEQTWSSYVRPSIAIHCNQVSFVVLPTVGAAQAPAHAATHHCGEPPITYGMMWAACDQHASGLGWAGQLVGQRLTAAVA